MSDSSSMEGLELLFDALEFAAERHKNQFRKGCDKPPYINHPIQVAALLIRAGEKDNTLLAASILHDVIEDTVDSSDEEEELLSEIRKKFGEEILSLTLEVTDDKNLRKPERKMMQVLEAPNKSLNAKKLKIADKIMNVKDMTDHPPVGWPLERILDYFDWSEQVMAGLRGVSPVLEMMFDIALREGRSKYESNK